MGTMAPSFLRLRAPFSGKCPPKKEDTMKEELLLEYLKTVCLGRGRIQKSAQMERALQISGNELRRLVHRLRKRGVPIASSRDGYFYAVTAGEVYTTIRQLRQMACGLEKAIAGLEGSLDKFGPGGGDP
ncbi:hypothetical protein AALD01_03025 [Oscillospiraceae bacterium 21-37]